MTPERAQQLRKAKDEVTEWLLVEDIKDYNLSLLDERLNNYACDVRQNYQRHNVFEQLALKRFLMLFARKYENGCLNIGRYTAFNAFYENLWFRGGKGLQHFELTPIQTFITANIYLFDNEDGTRTTREVCLFVPRKFSKTTFTASFALWDFMNGPKDSQAFVGANSFDQALLCQSVINDHLKKEGAFFHVTKEECTHLTLDRQSFIRCLTANANTKDGLNANVVIMDEFSQARSNDLLTTLTTSMGVRKEPLTAIITTASDVLDGPFYAMLQGYQQMLLGEIEQDDSVFPLLCMPDVDDFEGDENTWQKVQPHWGITVQPNFYKEQYQAALRGGAEAMLAFRTKLLNIFCVNEVEAWIPSEEAKKHSEQWTLADIPAITGVQKPLATLAFDMSVRNDFTAISLCIYDPRGWTTKDGEKRRGRFYFYSEAWLPEESIENNPNKQIYRNWIQGGYLKTMQGRIIDPKFVCNRILELGRFVSIQQIGYDSYKALDVVNSLASIDSSFDGIVAVRQTYGEFTAPVMSYQSHLLRGDISLFFNPLVIWAHGNCVLDEDRLGNCKPIKRSQDEKIDVVITNLMSYDLAIKIER